MLCNGQVLHSTAVEGFHPGVAHVERKDGTFELGVRAGFAAASGRWDVAVFGRNITDEENLKGVIDFNNNTGFVNDRRIWGATLNVNFGAY
jgi:hypothetical protein